MKTITLAIAMFAFTACATGPSPRAPLAKKARAAKPVAEMPARVQSDIDLSALDNTRLMQLLRGGPVRTDVRICVAPSGQVSKAEIVKGSGQEWFEAELLANIEAWTYQTYQAPVAAQRCQTVRVDFRG